MPQMTVDTQGNIVLKRTREEIINYYNREILKRTEALIKLETLDADTTAVKTKLKNLYAEKKRKLAEVKE